jgi:pullulanase/glycogen debranching enzyme
LPGAFRADRTPDPEAALARIPALKSAGVTVVEVLPLMVCRGPDELEPFLRQALAAVKACA